LSTTLNFSELISQFDLGRFLTENKQLSAEKYLLSRKDNTKELNTLLAQQISIYLKAESKIPTFALKHCWFTSKSYEQASSESSALFKSSLFKGNKILDLSGGLGVDDWAFSKSFKQVISLDPDEFLNLLVRENFKKLNIQNINRLTSSAEDFLENSEESFDLIFLDADRRSESGKVFFLEQGKPNYLEIEKKCELVCPRVLLKLSPMVDLTYLKKTLLHLSKIWIVGNKYEVKEVLALVDYNQKNEPEIEAVIVGDESKTLHFNPKNHKENTVSKAVQPAEFSYFFEPHPCIIKGNLHGTYAKENNLKLLSKQSLYYLGDQIPENFMGRSFRIIQSINFSKTSIKKYLKENNIKQANVSKRNFPLEVTALRKMFELNEGGLDYLFFTCKENGEKQLFHCKK
jgi:hypothetical protein